MDTITENVMQDAAKRVRRAIDDDDCPGMIHTVTIILNGQHGGADVIVEGIDIEEIDDGGSDGPYDDEWDTIDYKATFEVH